MVNNTKYGAGALQNNTSGTNNTAIGAYSAFSNLDASNNTAIGSNSSYYTTSGSNNTSLGAGSLCNNTTGSLNTAIGSSALEGSLPIGPVGNQNTAVGVQALYTNQGDQNTAIGAYSALGVTGGSYNTFLGTNTSALPQNLSYSTAIGYGAVIDASNQIMMGGNASGSYPNVVIPGLGNYTTYIPASYNSNTLVPKQYVDQFVSGLSIQGSVIAISTSDIAGTYNSGGVGSITGVSNPLIIDGITIQDGSGVLLIAQTDPLHNGTYTWSPGTTTLTRRIGMQNGESAAAAYVFVKQGTQYAKTAWVQTNNPAVVGTNDLNFIEFSSFDYELGRGLDVDNTGGLTTINVDTSLNFVNFLDSNTSISGANGTLAIGTATSNSIIIGPTGGIPIQAQSIIEAQQGITGGTGSFSYGRFYTDSGAGDQTLIISELTSGNTIKIIPNGGNGTFNPASQLNNHLIVARGNAQDTATLELTSWSNTNSAVLISPTSVTIGAGGAASTPTTSVLCNGSNVIITGEIEAQQGITGGTGSFSYLNSSNNTYLATTSGMVGVGKTSAGYNLDISGNFRIQSYGTHGGEFSVEDDITKFNYAGFNPNKGTKIFYNYPVTNNARTTFLNNGQAQGTNNGFDFYMCASSVPTPVLATITCGKIGIGREYANESLDVSGNVDISGNLTLSGKINALSGITGPTGSFNYITAPTGSFDYLIANDISANRIDVYDLSVNHLATIGTTTTNLASNYITTTGTINAGGLITAQAGITGATGSFERLICQNGDIKIGLGSPGSFVMDGFGVLNVTTAPVGMFNNTMTLSSSNINQIGTPNNNVFLSSNFPSGLTGATGSFNYLNVGIGNIPQSNTTLDVSGNTLIKGTFTVKNNSITYTDLGLNPSNRSSMYQTGTQSSFINSAPGGFTNFSLRNSNDTSNIDALYISQNNSGNPLVGIGKIAQYTLDVSGNINTNSDIILTGATGRASNILFDTYGSTTDYAKITWQSYENANGYLQIGTYDNATQSQESILITQEDFLSGNTYERMRINTTGIYINPTSSASDPSFGSVSAGSYILDVSGNLNISGQISAPGGITGATGSFNYLNSSNNTYLATTNGTRVGIGKTSPGDTLDVSGGIISNGIVCRDYANTTPQSYLDIGSESGANYIESFGSSLTPGNAAPLYFTNGYASETYMSIVPNIDPSNANIGVGKPNPAYTLDVSGNINTNSNIILTGTPGLTSTIKFDTSPSPPIGTTDWAQINWQSYSDSNSYLQIGTYDNATIAQESILITQEQVGSGGGTYERMRINNTGVYINPTSSASNPSFGSLSAGSYVLDVSGNLNVSGNISSGGPYWQGGYGGATDFNVNGSGAYTRISNIGTGSSVVPFTPFSSGITTNSTFDTLIIPSGAYGVYQVRIQANSDTFPTTGGLKVEIYTNDTDSFSPGIPPSTGNLVASNELYANGGSGTAGNYNSVQAITLINYTPSNNDRYIAFYLQNDTGSTATFTTQYPWAQIGIHKVA